MAGKRIAAIAVCGVLWAAPALAEGQLSIESRPSGAAVTLDGQPAGRTPLLLDAPAGTYRMQVKLPGRRAKAFSARVVDGLTTKRRVELLPAAPAAGDLRAYTRPAGGALYLDGRPIGGSPVYVSGLRPGRYRLSAALSGRESTARTVVIQPGLTSTVALSLPVAARPAEPRRAPERPRAVPARPKAPAPAAHVAAKRSVPAHAVAPTPDTPPAHSIAPHTAAKPAAVALATTAPVGAAMDSPASSAIAPSAPAWAIPWPDWRELLFWALMAFLLLGLGLHWRQQRQTRNAPAWHPARPARWLAPWPGHDHPDPASVAALAALSLGRWAEGAERLWTAVQSGAATAWHYHHLGLALQHQGRAHEAETAYRTAIQLAPDWEAPRFNLALALGEMQQPAQAIIAYRDLLARDPRHVDARFNLGHLYHELKMPGEAIAQWQAARKLAPRDAALKQNLRSLKQANKSAGLWPSRNAYQPRRAS